MAKMTTLCQIEQFQAGINRVKLNYWRRGNLRYLMHAGQRLINDTVEQSKIKQPVILAARRYGKSTLGLFKCVERCLQRDRIIARFLAPTLEQSQEIAFSIMEKLIQEDPGAFVNYVKSDKLWRVSNSYLMLGGFDTNRENKRGGEASIIVLDEEGSANKERYNYVVKSVLAPQLLHTKGEMWHLGTVPEELDHPFLTETVAQAEENRELFKFDIYQNPILDQEQINQAIKDSGGINSEHFKREYLNLYVKSETRLVIPEFNRDIHVTEHPEPEHKKWILSMDMGGIRDLHALVIGYYDFLAAKIIIEYERIWPINTPTQMIMLATKALRLSTVRTDQYDEYIDATPQTILDCNTLYGVNFQLPLKDDLDAGINNVRKLLGDNKLLINPRCHSLISNLEFGMWNQKRTDFERTTKYGHNDAIMALVYLCRMIDTVTNPYPKQFNSKYNTVTIKQEETQRQQIANLFGGKKR